MSQFQLSHFGRQEFRRYPLLDLNPAPTLPDHNFPSHIRRVLDPTDLHTHHLGTRIPHPEKALECPRTRRRFVFPDNYLLHRRVLMPLLLEGSKEVGFLNYVSGKDGKVLHFKDNLRTHNKVVKFEKGLERDLEARRRQDTGEKDGERETADFFLARKRGEIAAKKLQELKDRRVTFLTPERQWGYHPRWPADYDDLPHLYDPERLVAAKPDSRHHHGWTHSDGAESWFLESRTPSSHDDYVKFYLDCRGRKYVAPKMWNSIFPERC